MASASTLAPSAWASSPPSTRPPPRRFPRRRRTAVVMTLPVVVVVVLLLVLCCTTVGGLVIPPHHSTPPGPPAAVVDRLQLSPLPGAVPFCRSQTRSSSLASASASSLALSSSALPPYPPARQGRRRRTGQQRRPTDGVEDGSQDPGERPKQQQQQQLVMPKTIPRLSDILLQRRAPAVVVVDVDVDVDDDEGDSEKKRSVTGGDSDRRRGDDDDARISGTVDPAVRRQASTRATTIFGGSNNPATATTATAPTAIGDAGGRRRRRREGQTYSAVQTSSQRRPEAPPRSLPPINHSSGDGGDTVPVSGPLGSGITGTARASLAQSSSSSSARSPPTARPWRAGYGSSRRTQDRIRKVLDQQLEQQQQPGPDSSSSSSPQRRALVVLEELLKTPPHLCNAANVVCALTYSVKAMGRVDGTSRGGGGGNGGGGGEANHNYANGNDDTEGSSSTSSSPLRAALYQTLDVLHELVVAQHDEKLLSPRQLCNAAWAIAKHYDRDPGLRPTPQQQQQQQQQHQQQQQQSERGRPQGDGIPDRTNRGDDDDEATAAIRMVPNEEANRNSDGVDEITSAQIGTPQTRLEETIDEIARQLTSILREEGGIDGASKKTMTGLAKNTSYSDSSEVASAASYQKPKIKLGEVCMACWAYGKLRHRTTPPGWPGPPQIRRLSPTKKQGGGGAVIRYETWGARAFASRNGNDVRTDTTGRKQRNRFLTRGDGDDDGSGREAHVEDLHASVTDRLFDAIGAALAGPRNGRNEDGGGIGGDRGALLEDCAWSELANVGWAFASNGRCRSGDAEHLLVSLAREAAFRLRADNAVANNNNHTRLLVRDITQLVWSLGILQADNFRLADDLFLLVKALTQNLRLGTKQGATFAQGRPLRRWSCADLVQTSVALAHARMDEKLLLRAIFEEGAYRLLEGSSSRDMSSPAPVPSSALDAHRFPLGEDRRSFHPWEASILLWSQARLYLTGQQGIEFDEFTDDAPKFFLKALRERDNSFERSRIGPQEQANIVWSLVVLEKYQSPDAVELIEMIFAEAARACKENRVIQLEHAHQLWQAYVVLDAECPDAVKRVPEWFVSYLRKKWTLEKARDKISSARHKSLSKTLDLMGVDHINEHDEDIDVAIILQPNALWVHETDIDTEDLATLSSPSTNSKVSLAVEFDGPNHFTRIDTSDAGPGSSPNQPRTLGHTVLKYRLLKLQGWTVVRVPYYEFDKIPFWASMERQRYLQRKLKTHANIRFSEVDVSEYKALTHNRRSRFD